jgi:hypothetical protein
VTYGCWVLSTLAALHSGVLRGLTHATIGAVLGQAQHPARHIYSCMHARDTCTRSNDFPTCHLHVPPLPSAASAACTRLQLPHPCQSTPPCHQVSRLQTGNVH